MKKLFVPIVVISGLLLTGCGAVTNPVEPETQPAAESDRFAPKTQDQKVENAQAQLEKIVLNGEALIAAPTNLVQDQTISEYEEYSTFIAEVKELRDGGDYATADELALRAGDFVVKEGILRGDYAESLAAQYEAKVAEFRAANAEPSVAQTATLQNLDYLISEIAKKTGVSESPAELVAAADEAYGSLFR